MMKSPNTFGDLKRCTACGQLLPLTAYSLAGGHRLSQCRECRRAKDRQRGSRSQPYVSTSVPDDGPHYRLTFAGVPAPMGWPIWRGEVTQR
jgi:hypothetical protein